MILTIVLTMLTAQAQVSGSKSNPRQWVHVEYKENRQIRTRDWIYNNKVELIKVNGVGKLSNEPKKDGTHQKKRNKLKKILNDLYSSVSSNEYR
jgi:hypothetical protein